MENIKDIFNKFYGPYYFSRVDNLHPLDIYLGLDENTNKTLELRAEFKIKSVIGTSSISVKQYHKDEYNTIRFSLIDPNISGLFYKFCEDLIDITRTSRNGIEGYNLIIDRFLKWKKLFVTSKKNLLSESQIMGLIGEILYMSGPLAAIIGISNSLKSWSGQDLTHKDFSFDNTWAEVKTVRNSANSVRISSLEQLDSKNNGELAIYFLEKMSPGFNGITINQLILETCEKFLNVYEKDDFINKVKLQGYSYNDYYDNFVYEIKDLKRFLIAGEFPRLTRNSVNSAITKASYDLSIPEIMSYRIDQ